MYFWCCLTFTFSAQTLVNKRREMIVGSWICFLNNWRLTRWSRRWLTRRPWRWWTEGWGGGRQVTGMKVIPFSFLWGPNSWRIYHCTLNSSKWVETVALQKCHPIWVRSNEVVTRQMHRRLVKVDTVCILMYIVWYCITDMPHCTWSWTKTLYCTVLSQDALWSVPQLVNVDPILLRRRIAFHCRRLLCHLSRWILF